MEQRVVDSHPRNFGSFECRSRACGGRISMASRTWSGWLHVACIVDGIEWDSATIRFGIREVQGARNEKGFLQFRVNRRNLLLRDGGGAPDLLYREPPERLRQELSYVKEMNLNTIRLEGKLGSDDMFDLTDEMGILIMAGWQCCDFWQQWEKWSPADHEIATASTYSQISRLRRHPSLLVWLNGSDEAPPAQVETDSIGVLKERDWPNPVLSAAADRTSTITGPSGVKMSGPYDYVPPEYWYLDTCHRRAVILARLERLSNAWTVGCAGEADRAGDLSPIGELECN